MNAVYLIAMFLLGGFVGIAIMCALALSSTEESPGEKGRSA
ncbi:hypothetical protein [Geoalkalibacter subterraneus]|jgi:hypothetical protein|nr:hypothetical protein [Geoalkalibacter subterraneus]